MSAEKVIIIYSTPTCPWCKKLKAFLDENSISYHDMNVAEDKNARDEMIKKSGQMGVPVVEIDDEIMVGFNPANLKEKLGL